MKKLLAVLLAVLMLVPVISLGASAAYKENNNFDVIYPELSALESDEEIYPTIILPGINHSKYYVADENGNVMTDKKGNALEESLLLINQDNLVMDIISLIPNLFASLIFQNDAGLSDKVRKLADNVFKYMASDKDGVPVNNLVTYEYHYPLSEMNKSEKDWFYMMLPIEPICEVVGEENIYMYTFPLVGDPMESAKGLEGFIDEVLTKTGAEKVNLTAVSLGGTVLTAYLDSAKNTDKVNKILNFVACLDGTDILSDFMRRYDKGFNLEDENLYKEFFPLILDELAGSSDIGYFVNIALRILPRHLLDAVLTAAYSSIYENIITVCPQFWAMVPGADYEELASELLSGEESAQLKAKTDRFQTARVNLKNNFKKVSEKGTSVYSIGGYGLTYTDGEYCFFGIVKSTKTANGDGIIPVSSTLLGTTFAPKGQTLSEEYLANANAKYISPEKDVDASTAVFPERTWYFSGQHHEIGRNDVAIRLAGCIISGKVKDINTTPLFPQFNGARNTRSLVRPGGYLEMAEKYFRENTGSTSNSYAVLALAYRDAVKMLNNTLCNQAEADEAITRLQNALAVCGVIEAPEAESKSFSGFSILKIFSDVLYAIFKGNGFFEKL